MARREGRLVEQLHRQGRGAAAAGMASSRASGYHAGMQLQEWHAPPVDQIPNNPRFTVLILQGSMARPRCGRRSRALCEARLGRLVGEQRVPVSPLPLDVARGARSSPGVRRSSSAGRRERPSTCPPATSSCCPPGPDTAARARQQASSSSARTHLGRRTTTCSVATIRPRSRSQGASPRSGHHRTTRSAGGRRVGADDQRCSCSRTFTASLWAAAPAFSMGEPALGRVPIWRPNHHVEHYAEQPALPIAILVEVRPVELDALAGRGKARGIDRPGVCRVPRPVERGLGLARRDKGPSAIPNRRSGEGARQAESRELAHIAVAAHRRPAIRSRRRRCPQSSTRAAVRARASSTRPPSA